MSHATAAAQAQDAPVARTAPLAARDAAWLAALPCAALTLALIVVLGPVVGDVLLPGSSAVYWTPAQAMLRPEPHEQGRFLVALAGPLLLAGVTVLLARRPSPVPPDMVDSLVRASQIAFVAFAAICLAVQWGLTFPGEVEAPEPFHQRYFTLSTLAASAVGVVAIVAAARSPRARARAAGWARETPARRVGWTLAATLLTAIWLLHAFNTEGTVVNEAPAAAYHLEFTLNETFAVLNGRSPLVDYVAQYGSLWPYPVAAAMSLLGASIGVFTALMCLLSGLALLAMYGVLRRVTRSSLIALALFAPFLATSFFLLRGPLDNRYTFATIFADYPLRFAGPWLLAWLTARHLDGARPRAPWPLFLVAGLTVMNNTDHGIPALAALLAALAWTAGPLRGGWLRALAPQAAAGLLGAFALVSALTLVRAGALPDPALMLRFARLFAVAGYAMLPMPELGFHTVIYLTFAAALAAATVRALDAARREPAERVLTGMLAFSAIFGLASGTYYAGRSHPETLVLSFAAWSFTLALLTLLVVRQLAARRERWPEPVAVACLFAFCLAACSLAQTPAPWTQLDRLATTGEPIFREPRGQPFVAEHVAPGERVAILTHLGHRMGENLGVENVAPYASASSMPTVEQLDETVTALRDEGGRKLFLYAKAPYPEMTDELRRTGFTRAATDPEGYELWVDRGGA